MGACWYGRGTRRPPSHDHREAAGPRVVYLGGLGRSGTTLLERLLAARPGVCAAGETVHLWQRGLVRNELCGCGLPFAACPFWHRVGEHAFGGWAEIDPGRVTRLAASVDRSRFIPRLAAPLPGLARRPALARIAGFAGLPGGAFAGPALGGGPGRWWAELGPAHTVSGNPMRFTTGQVPITTDNRWRTALPAADRRLVTGLTLPLLAGYGYLRGAA